MTTPNRELSLEELRREAELQRILRRPALEKLGFASRITLLLVILFLLIAFIVIHEWFNPSPIHPPDPPVPGPVVP